MLQITSKGKSFMYSRKSVGPRMEHEALRNSTINWIFFMKTSNPEPLGGSFSNRENVRAATQFRRERQPQHLTRWFLLKTRSTNFHINSTSVITLVKQSIEINKPLPPSVQCLIDQIQVQAPTLVVATDQMPDHTYSREQFQS